MAFYKKHLILFFVLLIFLLMIVITINYFVDPGNQFYNRKAFEAQLSQLLLSKQPVMINANYNERALQKLMLTNLSQRPEILLLGSSHILPVSQNAFQRFRFYNAGVSSASLQDDIALYYLYQKHGWKPDTVIICLDPWLVLNDNRNYYKVSLTKEYQQGRSLLTTKSSFVILDNLKGILIKYTQLLSIDYLLASYDKLMLGKKNNMGFNSIVVPPNSNICPTCNIRMPDGSRLASKEQTNMTGKDVDASILKTLGNTEQQVSNAIQFDKDQQLLFESFVGYLVKNNINVIFYFPPMEPLSYQEVINKNPNYDYITMVAAYYNKVASQYHIKILSSNNPSRFDLQAGDFLDDWHLKDEPMRRIFSTLNL